MRKTKKKKKMKNKKLMIIMLMASILLIGTTYAWLTLTLNGTKTSIIKAGTLSLVLDEENSIGINLEDLVPVRDSVGLGYEAYTFKLKNDGTLPSNYTIYLDDVKLETGEKRMLDKYVKYSLTKDGVATTQLLTKIGENPNRILDSGVIEKDTTHTYTLRLWIDQDADNGVMGTTFRGNLRIESSQKMENEPTPETFKLADKILEKNGGKDAILEKDTPDFNTVPTTNEGMYATEDNSGTSYYFRGAMEDNYVTFASKTWRIMRINGDVTIRLIMQNGINSNKLISFNTIRNSYTHMYYTNSTAQKELNDWYSVNTLTNYENEVITS